MLLRKRQGLLRLLAVLACENTFLPSHGRQVLEVLHDIRGTFAALAGTMELLVAGAEDRGARCGLLDLVQDQLHLLCCVIPDLVPTRPTLAANLFDAEGTPVAQRASPAASTWHRDGGPTLPRAGGAADARPC